MFWIWAARKTRRKVCRAAAQTVFWFIDDFCVFYGVCYGLNESCLWRWSVCSSDQVHPLMRKETWGLLSSEHLHALSISLLFSSGSILCAPNPGKHFSSFQEADLLHTNQGDIIRRTTTPWWGKVFIPQFEITPTALRLICIASPRLFLQTFAEDSCETLHDALGWSDDSTAELSDGSHNYTLW